MKNFTAITGAVVILCVLALAWNLQRKYRQQEEWRKAWAQANDGPSEDSVRYSESRKVEFRVTPPGLRD